MAVKTQEDAVHSHPPQASGAAGGGDYASNGSVTPMVTTHTAASPPSGGTAGAIKHLSAFQEKYMKRLVANFERAKASVDAAQNAANEFIVACGEEAGIQVGVDGWTFELESLEFVRVPSDPSVPAPSSASDFGPNGRQSEETDAGTEGKRGGSDGGDS